LPFTISLPAHMAGAPDVIQPELSHLLKDVELEYRVATETGVTDWSTVGLGDHLAAAALATSMSTIAV
jgi:hypothetical protein